jgi:hypothetical protein
MELNEIRDELAQELFQAEYAKLSSWGKMAVDARVYGTELLKSGRDHSRPNTDALYQKVAEQEQTIRRQARELADLWEENEDLKMRLFDEDSTGRSTE